MAVSVATLPGDLLARESLRRDTQPLTIRPDDAHGLKTRIRALVGFWENLSGSNALKAQIAAPNGGNSNDQNVPTLELFQRRDKAAWEETAPPAYEDCLNDTPPDYTTTDALATVQDRLQTEIVKVECKSTKRDVALRNKDIISGLHMEVDFSEIDNVRTHAKKKAKQAAKAAQAAKWADSDDEEKKDGTEENAGGDDNNKEGGDAGAGGDGGGDPPGGGGGGDDDDDWWNTGGGGKKNKKKKKKNAWEEFEEQEQKEAEEKKKAEEEEAAAAAEADAGAGAEAGEADPADEWGSFATVGKKGKKKKGKVDLDPEPIPEPVVEAPPPPADDDWGGFTTTSKKKKGKKGKDAEPEVEAPPAEPEPPMETVDLGATAEPADDWGAFATVGKKKKKGKNAVELTPEPAPEAPKEPDAPAADNADGDDWTGFGSKKKKDKKGKKNDPVVEAPKDTSNDMKLDDIDLNDDKGAPKLDLDLGFGKKTESPTENKSSGFSFGGWGSGWGGGSSSWGFGSNTEAPAETKQDDTSWGFGGKKDSKDDKKKKSAGTGWSFDALGDETKVDDLDLGAPAAKEEPKVEDDPWGSFAAVKGKKSKKKGVVEPVVEAPPPPPPPVEEKKEEEDPWASFSTKKDKKSKKKASIWDAEPEPTPPPPPAEEPIPEPPKEEPKAEEDIWGTFGGSAKDKKKAKKAAKNAVKEEEKPAEEPIPEPIVEDVPPPPADDAFETWGVSTGKKKKDKKKNAAEPEPIVEVVSPPVEEKPADDPWGAFGSKKDKKKKTGGFSFDWADESAAADPIVDVPPPPPAVKEEPANDWLGGGWGDTGKKAKKGKKGAVEELPPPPPPPPEPAADEGAGDDWLGGWGTKSKDKKKKGKADILDVPAPEADINAFLMPEAVVEPKAEGEDDWANTWSTGTKKKASKTKDKSKGIVEVSDPSPGASVLLPESVQEKSAEEDPWGSWTVGKKTKKKDSKKTVDPPPVEEPVDVPAVGADLLDMTEPPAEEDPWSFTSTTKKKSKADKKTTKAIEAPKAEEVKLTKTKSKDSKTAADDIVDIVEPPAVPEPEPISTKKDDKASSGWGIWGSTTKKETPKEKKAREKREKEEREAAEAEEKRKAEEEAFAAALGDEPNDILDFEADEPAPPPPPPAATSKSKKSSAKDSKIKGSDKLSKVDSKSSKKSEPKEEEPAPIVEVIPDPAPILDFEEPKKAEGWGFWGSSLKKKATAASGLDSWANQDAALPKMPDTSFGDDWFTSATPAAVPPPPKATGKTKGGSSIQDRIKALHADSILDSAAKSSKSKAPAIVEPEIDPIIDVLDVPPPPPVAEKKSKKSATTAKSSSKKKEKEPTPPAEEIVVPPPPPSVSPVPGGFPMDDMMDDMDVAPEPEPVPSPPKKSSSKDKKSSSKSKKESKSKAEPIVVEAPPPPPPADFDDLLGDDAPPELPTPPPESESPKEKKSGKKERPKVVRDHASTSWGFWGATPAKKTPRKESSARDDVATPSAKVAPPGLVRSKSARKASDRDPLEKASKSSGSDKGAKRESRSRPSTSRGFSLFGAPTPSRSKSTRQSSSAAKSSSRRPSAAIEDSGLISPPPEEREIPSKAAKLTGVSRSKSSSQKKPRMVPDPYPISSDDMIMVDGPEDSAKDIEEPRRKKSSRSKSKREPSYMSGGLGAAEDDIMADAPRQSEEAKVFSGADDLAFDERPAPVRRATSSAKKTTGLMGGILGAFSSRPTPDRRQSRVYESEDGTARRKRGSAYEDEQAKRLRREDRQVNRSRKPSEADVTEYEDAEAREARRRERRERREREAAEEEARMARRREKERARAREEEQRVLREEEDREARRRARRAERESRKAEEDRLAREEEMAREERRERRRERERQRMEETSTPSRPKAERHRSYADTPDDEEARRARREERRMRRSVDERGGDKERVRSSRRRSEYPAPVGDYFDRRNGEHPLRESDGAAASPIAHAIKTGKDKTSSWVDSVNEEPPPPPPVEGTIVDAPLHFAPDETPDRFEDDEKTARELRSRRRRERDRDDGYGDDDSERRRRREGIKSSDGSSYDRRKSYAGPDMGIGNWDPRPAPTNRRTSWFKKIAGL